jgi:anti-sigma factor RsiW
MSECCKEGSKDTMLAGLCDLLDGDENTTLCQAFKKHMAECDRCRVVVDSLKKTIRVYKDNAEVPIPQEFRDALDKALRKKWEEKFASRKR